MNSFHLDSRLQELDLDGYRGLIIHPCVEAIEIIAHQLPLRDEKKSKGYVFQKGDIYVKSFSKKYADKFFGSAARREFNLYQQLKALKINTPKALGFLEGKGESLFFSSAIQENCHSVLIRMAHEKQNEKILSFLQEMAIFINDLLNKGMFHGDLKLANILYDAKFYIIDLFGASLHSKLREKKKIHSYAQVFDSLSEILSSLSFGLEKEFLQKFLVYLNVRQDSELTKKVLRKALRKRKRRIYNGLRSGV